MELAAIVFNIVLVFFLVALNGFFVAAEFAMVKVRSTRLDTLIMEGNARAKYAKNITDHLDSYLSACQLGITLASLGLGWVGEPAVGAMIEPALTSLGLPSDVIHTISFAIAFSIITALHIIIGELAPKSLAIQKSEGVTLWTAMPLIGFYKLMYPFIWVLNAISNKLLGVFGVEVVGEHQAAHTEEEIRILMEESHKQGYIDQTELTFVDNIFNFAERHAREVMIPRTDMVCLYVQNSFEENLEIALTEELTRYPLCNEDKDNIIGFIHIKDLLSAAARGQHPNIRDLVRSVVAVPESMAISDLLKLLQKDRAQLAIVVDEFGGTAGLVTVEDILEEIVGEIQDEFDEERPLIENRGPDEHSVDGKLLIEEVNNALGLKLDSETFDTMGGWIYSRIEMPPQVNQKIVHEGHEFIIEEVDNRRVNRVLIRKLAEEPTIIEID
ncbi:MAG: HlyC/CorC family transporter [Veillonellaceae bacterium]|nr:HlyC/CorC family transporter [Veillonellaceae bacterium]